MSTLIDVNERLKTNLSGHQIVTILDHFLYNAMMPIALHTPLVRELGADILSQALNDNRRKISHINRDELVDSLFTSLVVPETQQHWEFFKESKLDRNILMQFFERFFAKIGSYEQHEIDVVRDDISVVDKNISSYSMGVIEEGLQTRREVLGAAIRWVRHYRSMYLTFKEMIIEKYIRLAYTHSMQCASGSNNSISADDLFKNLLLAVDRALSKYSPAKGALTSYIKYWFKDAKANPKYGHEIDKSMGISSNTKRNLTQKNGTDGAYISTFAVDVADIESMSEDVVDSDFEQEFIQRDTSEKIIKYLSALDEFQFAKLYLDLPYLLSEEEKKMQMDTILRQ